MPFKQVEELHCDVLVIGSGGAGLRAAIAAAENGADVLLTSKARIGRATNTYLSKAVIASSGWDDPKDSSDVHSRDTMEGGRYLNDPASVYKFTEEIRAETVLLREWGVEFSRRDDGRPAVIKIPGHTYARHLFGKNWRGTDLVNPLKEKAAAVGVRFRENLFIASLLVVGNRVVGCTGISADGIFVGIQAKSIILATGGFGHVYLNTNNAAGITGDGHALAWRCGVEIQDIEFVQFYPTALGRRGSRLLLYERILVQDGVVLRNSSGDDILKKNGYNNPAEITRDHLAQVIMKEIKEDSLKTGSVIMDMTGLSDDAVENLAMLLPSKWAQGIRKFEVTSTAHFCMGGVVVDAKGETSCGGLFAAGEVVAGAHGANRLGGNALAEVIAMGALVGKSAAVKSTSEDGSSDFDALITGEKERFSAMMNDQGVHSRDLIQILKETMWFNAGIVRTRQTLETALKTISELDGRRASITTPPELIRFLEFKNMCLVGQLVCRCALTRNESRGSHYRSDFPVENNDDWLKNIRVKDSGGTTLMEII